MTKATPHISVITPEYKGEKMVSELVARLVKSISTITDSFEIILVNDGSPDKTWLAIEQECHKDNRVKGLNLSRNFGQHYAITAGLNYAKGDWVVVMDCDLQDRPEEIPNLYEKAQEGYDIVYARRMHNKFGFLKQLSSHLFHWIFDWLSGMQTDKTVANFGIYSHQVISEFNKMPEVARSFTSLVYYLGFRIATVDVEHGERVEGTTTYNLRRLLKLTFDIIISNSNKPLYLAINGGIIMSLFSFALALYNIIAKWVGIIHVDGYTTTVFSIWFVGGLLLMMMGVLGLYIGKIFNQVKGRQIYIVRDKLNFDENN
ncbi:MAG: glycosyltransferase family 2 protein [Paludibacteraceae bacterium]|nr:glycosyltransferase family 2 protein [Paludibacteraceae bacterium]